jgi:transcription termination factor Rho
MNLKELKEKKILEAIFGEGVLEILPDGFGFLRAPGCQLPARVRMIFTFRRHRSAASTCAPATRSPGRFALPKRASGTLPCSRCPRSTLRIPRSRATRPFSTTSPRSIPRNAWCWKPSRTTCPCASWTWSPPSGKGQRGLIVAPPRTGKTVLLQKIANSITTNHPDVKLIVLLIDERPEEVTDMQRNTKGKSSPRPSTSRRNATCRWPKWSLKWPSAWWMHQRDVVILLDSITRLARAYNTVVPPVGQDSVRWRRCQCPAQAQALLRCGAQY